MALGTMAAIGAGVGALQGAEERSRFAEAADMAATRSALMSFLGERSGVIPERPSMFQNILVGALSGAGVAGKNPSQFQPQPAQQPVQQPVAQGAAGQRGTRAASDNRFGTSAGSGGSVEFI